MAQKIKNVHEKFTERENELRLAIINETVNNGRAFDLEEVKVAVLGKLQMSGKEYKEICERLLEEDGMVLDGTKVNFIYPVSALPTNHRVTLADGRTFTAMCAIDAIGAAFTFHQDTEVHSVSAVSGEPVFVKITDGKVAEYSPKELHALTFPLGEMSNWAGSC